MSGDAVASYWDFIDETAKNNVLVKTHNLSVASVSKASGVSHATFYNKPILSRYVHRERD